MLLSRDIADYPDGLVLAVDKPWRWTSADVIRKIKYAAIRHFGKKNLKVGHAGTLDPLATGVLLVCIGRRPFTQNLGLEELGIELDPPENSHVETLSGLIQATLGIIPSPGAEVKIQGYTFRVLKMDGTRMEKVMLILPPGKAGPKTQALKKI